MRVAACTYKLFLSHGLSIVHALVQTVLESMKFFSKPKLALDAVGGSSAARLADALVEVRRRYLIVCNSAESASSRLTLRFPQQHTGLSGAEILMRC